MSQPTDAAPSEALAPEATHPVRRAAHEGLRLYKNLDKLDRFGGGGFALSTLVKLAGWAGLLFILGTLVTRLRTVEQQLDPVSNGVAKLQAELDAARLRVNTQASASAVALGQLGDDAQGLRKSLGTARERQARISESLGPIRDQELALGAQLQADLDGAKATAGTATSLAEAIAAYGPQLASAKGELAAQLEHAGTSSADLGSALTAAQTRAAGLDQALKALDVAPTRAALQDVEVQARGLADELAASRAKAAELNRLLAARLAEESARAPLPKAAPADPASP